MPEREIVSHGEWESPITAADVARARVGVAFPVIEGPVVWWQENAPVDGGRTAVVRRGPDGTCAPVLPVGFQARTRVHEYGGRSYLPVPPRGGGEWAVVFANHDDQRLYLVESDVADVAVPLTPRPEATSESRYADFALSPDGAEVWCVREAHAPDLLPRRAIVAVPLDGAAAEDGAAVRELVVDTDFLAFPTPSPDGEHLAWTGWNRPDMPWDAAGLHVARLDPDGPVRGRRLLGGPAESVLAPVWRDAGSLFAASDRSGWWNLHLVDLDGRVRDLLPAEEEFADPLWTLGGRPFAVLEGGDLAVLHGRGALRLGVLDPDGGRLRDVPVPQHSFVPALSVSGRSVCAVAHGLDAPGGVVVVDVDRGGHELVRAESAPSPHAAYLPRAEAVELTDAAGQPVHAFRYAPANPRFRGPDDELPPYVVWAHGGPTGHETGALDLAKAYFTSRGIGVLDVNYGGSSGYGRAYRDRLRGNWGVVDADDVVSAARALVEQGVADANRLAVRGGSAGGWTALVAVTSGIARNGPVFAAATSYFGVTDVESLAKHTHDFEAGYFDSLIGPSQASAHLYRSRSPLGHVTAETCPLLLLQGLRDPVVPPGQAVALISELVAHGIDHQYIAFADESHGFKDARTVRACLEAELAFYGRVLGFTPSTHGPSRPPRPRG
ncbi:prolyl oligopeptidase family serine peptidase [Saccharothrix xinjiangensis]|uniref:Prolyl oligopeptidase family serine peptidase n=1 Tax=Saccharothrix xinjiangensis TaxID=204798 RepID=A0ABV9XVT6_9PSEU